MNRRKRGQSDISWFFENVKKTESCWLWTRAKDSQGYGRIELSGKKNKDGASYKKVHRFSWEYHFGPIEDNKHVLHKCDVRTCVNPDHLFLGTNDDNVRDRNQKNRQATAGKHGAAKLTMEKAEKIRELYTSEKYSTRSLGIMFGVAHTQIAKIIRGTRWVRGGA